MAPSANQSLDIEDGRADIGLVRLPTLRKYPHIHVRELWRERGANLCLEHGFFPTPARALSRKSSQLSLIEAGLGIAIVPECMRLMAPAGVRFVPLAHGTQHTTVGLACRREADPLGAAFADALLRLVQL